MFLSIENNGIKVQLPTENIKLKDTADLVSFLISKKTMMNHSTKINVLRESGKENLIEEALKKHGYEYDLFNNPYIAVKCIAALKKGRLNNKIIQLPIRIQPPNQDSLNRSKLQK